MCAVDPMHAILLGLVKKEINILLSQDASSENAQCSLTTKNREIFKQRLRAMEVPSDCGRLPSSILDKASVDGVTAQQWLLFASVYARPCFYDLIPARSYECLRLLCEVVDLCGKYRISEADLNEIKVKIQDHHRLFGSIYGKWNVSINNHMALHLHETMRSFGPCHTVWCFASERLNGMLADLPTSGRVIEKEIFQRFLLQQQLAKGNFLEYLPEQMKNDLQKSCPAIFKIAQESLDNTESESESGRVENEKHIERIRTEEFLSSNGQVANDTFQRQRKTEMQENDYNFAPAVFLPPERHNKLMSNELYEETSVHLKDLFGNRFVYLSPTMKKYG